MILATVLLLLPIHVWAQCDEGWTHHDNHCYKKMSAPEANVSSANDVCLSEGATLTSVTDSERLFLIEFSRNGHPTHLSNQTIIGMTRKSVFSSWQWRDGANFGALAAKLWLPNGATIRNQELCSVLVVDPAHWNGKELFNGQFGYMAEIGCGAPAVKFVCKKATGTLQQLKRAKRSTGVNEKCELLGRQHNVSMIFIIDSSVNKENWEAQLKDSDLDELLGNACRETKLRMGNPQQRTIFAF